MNLLKNTLDALKSEIDFEILDFNKNISNEERINFIKQSFKVLNDCLIKQFSLIKLESKKDINFIKFLFHQGFDIEVNDNYIESEDDIFFEKDLVYKIS